MKHLRGYNRPMAELPGFQRKQFAFAAHIRDPDHVPRPPGIEDRRIAIYRELFFNNLLKLLGSTFPVMQKILAPKRFRELVREFMIRHRAKTPYFLEIPREFMIFLEKEREPAPGDPPFLEELAHYEWVELALSVASEENDLSGIDADGDLLAGVPVRSVLARLCSYRFPVHRVSPEYLPDSPGDEPTHLVVYRRANDELGFMELNAVTARLLAMIAENDRGSSGRVLLQQLAGDIRYPDGDALVRHGAGVLQEMRAKEILLGTRELP